MSCRKLRYLFLFFALTLTFSAFMMKLSYSVIVEKIAASMDDKVFTLTDLEIAKEFDLLGIVFGTSKYDDTEYLDKLIDSELIYREALLLDVVDVKDEEVDQVFIEVKKKLLDKFVDSLKEYDITKDQLVNLIREKLIAKKHLDMRKNFFSGFGDIEGKKKFDEWLDDLRKKASIRIIK